MIDKFKLFLIRTRKASEVTRISSTLTKIQEFSKYYREQIEVISNTIFDATIVISELENELRDYNKQLMQISNNTKEKRGEIKLKLDTAKSTSLNLEVKYNVSSAGWFPVYDVKTKSTKNPLSLKYRAHLYQKTGEDWNDVKIVLSTGDPSINNNKPELDPHFLNFSTKYSSFDQNKSVKSYGKKYNPMIRRVVGTILDQTGQPLAGVNIAIKGTSEGAISDFDGEYSIDIKQGERLVYSFVGYNSKETPIYSSVMNVQLEIDLAQLGEVVITGYSTRKGITGIAAALQGKAAGIKIRGTTTAPIKKEIIYIVDGVPTNDISYLNNSEIDNYEVLDDATSSIYGSRASNGVVVITTKEYSSDENIINKQFIIKKTYSIASVSDITVIDIDTFELPATYEYMAAPVINENVFLIAEINKWEHLDLLPGEANIYFKGAYAGKTYINPLQTKKGLKISLGVDSNIIVSRKQVNSLKDKSFAGNTRIINKTYELTLKNNKNSEVHISLLDRIPISQNKEIKVDKVTHENANYDTKKGILKWNVVLSPGNNIKKKVSFQIKYPKGESINL